MREVIDYVLCALCMVCPGSAVSWNRKDCNHKRSPWGPCPQILALVVILCLEKRRPKQKYCCSPKAKHFGPLKIFDSLRRWLQQVKHATTAKHLVDWSCKTLDHEKRELRSRSHHSWKPRAAGAGVTYMKRRAPAPDQCHFYDASAALFVTFLTHFEL